ncbi:MAG: arsenite methyltransferase [Caldilineaceae bacterium]
MTASSDVHGAVQQHYGAIAERQAACCCGPEGCGESVQLYDSALVADLPIEVTSLSLGCGDPVTIAGLQPGETVLDLGSGGGIDCFLAARQVGETGFVIGVDMTPAMLERANAHKQRMGAHNVEFRRGQIEALPVVSDTVDVVMSNCVINLSPDKRAVFAEIFRVLKPGGRVSVSDIVTEGAFDAVLQADLTRWSECVTGAIDLAEYTGLMREAGFADLVVVDKANADAMIEHKPGMPHIFSARITARKPA